LAQGKTLRERKKKISAAYTHRTVGWPNHLGRAWVAREGRFEWGKKEPESVRRGKCKLRKQRFNMINEKRARAARKRLCPNKRVG